MQGSSTIEKIGRAKVRPERDEVQRAARERRQSRRADRRRAAEVRAALLAEVGDDEE